MTQLLCVHGETVIDRACSQSGAIGAESALARNDLIVVRGEGRQANVEPLPAHL